MDKFAVQYLEDGPSAAALAPEDVRTQLRAALERVPISYVLLGWAVPPVLVDACRDEANRAGAQLFRWHPLLTGDGTFVPRPEWQTVGLDGNPVAGFRGMPEFTFVCPNRPAVREAVLGHLHAILQRGDYQGIFLDRIRYPSPAPAPVRLLACFCDDCRRAARAEGLDLEEIRQRVRALPAVPERAGAFVRTLLDPQAPAVPDADLAALRAFLDFRTRSVTGFVRTAADLIRAAGLGVGLDCFSPALTHMVGQALGDLDGCCEWIKIMSYGHALGPAGLPFELLDLADWLVAQRLGSEPEALSWLSRATCLPMPPSRVALREGGLAPEALAAEVGRARASGVRTLLAGIELVEIEGVTNLNTAQIKADLRAFRDAGADGLALSWDLWHISRERLELVRGVVRKRG
jgi:hypothetical protein